MDLQPSARWSGEEKVVKLQFNVRCVQFIEIYRARDWWLATLKLCAIIMQNAITKSVVAVCLLG